MAELADVERKLQKAVPGSAEQQKLLSRYTALKSQLEGLKTEAEKRLTDWKTGVQSLEDALTDYVSSLNEAITGLLDSVNDTLKGVSDRLKAQREQLEKTLKSYLRRGTRVSPVEEETEVLNAQLEDLNKQREQLDQLSEALRAVEEAMNSGQTKALEQALSLLANNQALPKDASPDVKSLYTALKGRLSPKEAKDLLDRFTQGLGQVQAFIDSTRAELDKQVQAHAETVNQVQKHGKALIKRAELQEETEKLTEQTNKLRNDFRAADNPMAYRGAAEAIVKQAQALLAQVADLKAQNPKLDTTELERSLEELKRIPAEYLSAAVEKVIAKLPQPSDVLNYTDAELARVKEALSVLDTLDAAIAQAVDPQLKATLKDLRKNLADALLRLVRDGKDSMLSMLEKYLEPEVVARLRDEAAAKEFETQISDAGKDLTIKVSSLGDIPEMENMLTEREALLAKLKDKLAEMRASGRYRPELLDEWERRLTELEENLQAAKKELEEQEYQLFVRQDNELLTAAKESVEATDTAAKEMLLAGKDISEALDLYRTALNGIANLPLHTEEAKAQVEELKRDINSRLVGLLTDGTPNATKALQGLFGEALDFLTSVEGFGRVDDPAVRARIIEAVKSKLKEQGFDLSNEQAESLVRALVSQAAEAAKTGYENAVKELRDIGFSDLAVRLGRGDLTALEGYGPKLEAASKKLSQLMHAATLLSQFGEKLEDGTRDEFLRFASETLGSVGTLSDTLQRLAADGKLSELAVTDWLEQLRDTLQFVRGLLLSMANTLGLSQEQLAALEKQLDDSLQQLEGQIKQNKAKALQLYLRGDLTSEEFSRRVRGTEVLLGAQSLTEFGQLADGLVQAYRKLAQAPGLSEGAIRSRVISQLSAAAALDDRSLAKLVAPDLSESELNAFLNSQVASERLEALRAAIKRAINDLQEEAQRELEQMLNGLVDSLRNALANLFTSIFTIPVQMLKAWREQQKALEEMRFELRLSASDVEYWQQKYNEAVETYGVLSEEARKYAERVAEAKRAHEELSQRIKNTEESARSLFSYLLDAIAQFLEALAQAIMQQAAFRTATWIVDTAAGALFGGTGQGGTGRGSATVSPQAVTKSPQAVTVSPQGATATASSVQPYGTGQGSAGSQAVSGIISVGSSFANRALAGVVSSLGVAAPVAGLVAGMVVSMAADWVADIADRAFNSRYYTYIAGTKGRFDDMQSPVRLQQPVNVNVQVQAELDRNKIAKETVDKLVRELVHNGV